MAKEDPKIIIENIDNIDEVGVDWGSILSGAYLQDSVVRMFGDDTQSKEAGMSMVDNTQQQNKNAMALLKRIDTQIKEKGLIPVYSIDKRTNTLQIGFKVPGGTDVHYTGNISVPNAQGRVLKDGIPAVSPKMVRHNKQGTYMYTSFEAQLESIVDYTDSTSFADKINKGDYKGAAATASSKRREAAKGVVQIGSAVLQTPDQLEEEMGAGRGTYSQGKQFNNEAKILLAPLVADIAKSIHLLNNQQYKNERGLSHASQSRVLQDFGAIIWDMVSLAMTDGIEQMEAVYGDTEAFKLLKSLGLYGEIKTALMPLMKINGSVAAGTENSRTNLSVQAAANVHRFNAGKSDSSRHLSQISNYGKTNNRGKKRKTTSIQTKHGRENGYDYTDNSEQLYRIVYLTEKQISEELKEFLSQGDNKKKYGNISLGGLHDDGMLLDSKIFKEMDYERVRTETFSAEDIEKIKARIEKKIQANPQKYKAFGVMQDAEGNAIYSDAEVAKILAQQLWGGKGLLKGTIEGKRLEDGSYNLTLKEKVKGGDGSKLLGAHTGERATATGVPTEFLKHLQKKYKLKNTPEAIRQAGKIKTNQIGGIITGILEEVLESDKIEGEAKQEKAQNLRDKLKKHPKFKDIGIEVDKDGRLVFDTHSEAYHQLTIEDELDFLEKNGIVIERGTSDDKGRSTYKLKDGMPLEILEPLNPADTYDWTKEVKIGKKEREAVSRSVATAKMSADETTRKQLDSLSGQLRKILEVPEDQRQVAENEERAINTALKNTATSKQNSKGKHEITIGKGSDYDINIEEFLGEDISWEQGGLTAEEFGKTIWGRIEQVRAAKAKELGIDPQTIPVSVDTGSFATTVDYGNGTPQTIQGNRVYLPNIAPQKRTTITGDEVYSVPGYHKETSKLLYGIAEGNQGKIVSSAAELMQTMYGQAHYKEGSTYDKKNSARIEGSASFKATAVNAYDAKNATGVEQKILTSGVQFAKKDIEKMLSQGEKSEKEYVEMLRNQYKHLYGENPPAEYGPKELKQKIIAGITVGSPEFEARVEKGYTHGLSMLHLRYPSINGQDMKSVSGYIGQGIGQGVVRVGAGEALSNRTDYDGDMGNFIPLLLTGKDAESALAGSLVLQQQQDKISAAMLASANFDKEEEALISVDSSIQGQETANVGGVVGKKNRPKIGIFSNIATKIRNAMSTNSDELSGNQDLAASGIITRALFESLEQDAISSKKVEQRILKKAGKEGASGEDKQTVLTQAYTDLENLVEEIMNPNSGYTLPTFIQKLQDMGILGDESALLEGKIAQQAIATIQQLPDGDEILKKMGLDESSLYQFQADGTVAATENSGKINLKTVNHALATTTNNIGAIFGNGGAATKRALQPESKNDAYAMMNLLKELGVNVSGEATEGELYYDGLSESVKLKKPSQNGGTEGTGSGSTIVVSNEPRRETFSSMAGKFKSIPREDKFSVSDEKNMLFPYGQVRKTGFPEGSISSILEMSGHGRMPLSIQQLLSLTGFENEGALKDAASSFFTTKGGDLAHMVAQAQTPQDFADIQGLVAYLSNLSQALAATGVNFNADIMQHIGSNFQSLVSGYGQSIGSEFIIGGVTPDGKAINGRMDQLMYGQRQMWAGKKDGKDIYNPRNAFTIVDYKTHKDGKLTAEDIYQVAQYQDMLQQIQTYAVKLQGEGKSIEEISTTIGNELPQLLKGAPEVIRTEILKQWNPDFIAKLISKDAKGSLPAILASVAVGNSQTGKTQLYEINGQAVKNQHIVPGTELTETQRKGLMDSATMSMVDYRPALIDTQAIKDAEIAYEDLYKIEKKIFDLEQEASKLQNEGRISEEAVVRQKIAIAKNEQTAIQGRINALYYGANPYTLSRIEASRTSKYEAPKESDKLKKAEKEKIDQARAEDEARRKRAEEEQAQIEKVIELKKELIIYEERLAKFKQSEHGSKEYITVWNQRNEAQKRYNDAFGRLNGESQSVVAGLELRNEGLWTEKLDRIASRAQDKDREEIIEKGVSLAEQNIRLVEKLGKIDGEKNPAKYGEIKKQLDETWVKLKEYEKYLQALDDSSIYKEYSERVKPYNDRFKVQLAADTDEAAAEAQAEKEAASKKNLAESNKLLKQKLGYEKELIKIQAKVNKLQEDGTEGVAEDIKKLEERIKELRKLINDTEIEYQTARTGITEDEDIIEANKAVSDHDRKIRDEERRAKWAEEDRKAKAEGREITVDSSKISKKDQETLREAKILFAQLFKAREELGTINREIKAFENKEKNGSILSGEEQERLGVLRDRQSDYTDTVKGLSKQVRSLNYETDAGSHAAHLMEQGKLSNFKFAQKGKSIQFADKQQQIALREYEQTLNEILRKEERLYQIRMQKSTSTNKREIDALEQEERLLSSQVDLLRQKHEEQKKNPALLKQGANGKPQLIEGALTANAEFESKMAAMEAKTFSQNKGATSIWHQIGANFQTSIQRVFNYGAAMKVAQSIPQAFKKIIEVSKELDAVMTDLRVVTGYNRAEAINLMKSYNGLAKSLGATTQEVAKSADTWLRQGYSVADTNQLITSTMYLAKLGQIESGQASQYMTSMLKGFKLEASEAMSVVDKLVALDKQYAVTAGGVAEALSRTAVSAQMAGVELDKIAAMVTVITDVSQKSADTVGESMKTLFARYGNVKSGVFEDLTDSSGETTENINDIEKVLNSVGIRVRSSSLEFREMDDVLEELAGKWIGLTTVEKNAIATAMAGTRQRENFNIMMENYDEILKATETSLNANGTAEKGYAAITESVSYQMNQMTNAWDQLALQMDTNPIFVQLTKWGVDLLEVLPQIIQYILTFISITKSKALLGGLKDLGLGATNALFGTKFGYGKSSNVGKSAGLFNKNGVSKDFLGKETGKINSTLEDILRAVQGKAVRDSGSILGSDSDNYATYLKLSSSDNKKARKLAKKMDNPLYEMAKEQGVTAEGFEEFEAKMGEMAKVVGEATMQQRKKMQADMNSIVQAKKEAMEKAKARAEQAKADMEYVLASKTATKAERDAAIANEHEARASYEAAQADYNEAQGQQGNLNTLVGKANKQTKMNGWKQAGSTALMSGIMGGITSATGAYATTEGDEEDKKDAAIKQGTGSAVGTAVGALGYAIPGWGAIVGPITTSLGGMIGNLFGEKSAEAERERKYAEQNAAKKQAEQGEKALQILQSSNGAMEQMSSMVRTKDDWTANDEASMESYIDAVKETLYLDSGLREEFVDNVKALNKGLISTNDPIEGFKDALTILTEGTEEQAREVMRQLEIAKIRREKEELENSQKLEDYQNKKKMNEGIGASGKLKGNEGVAGAFEFLQGEGFDVDYKESISWFQTYFDAGYDTKWKSSKVVISEIETIIERLLYYQAANGVDLSSVISSFETKLEGYKGALAGQDKNVEALDELSVKEALLSSKVYMWDSIDIRNATLDEAIDEIADNLELAGVKVRDGMGVITDDARRMIMSELKQDTRYSSLMKVDNQSLNSMLKSNKVLSEYAHKIGDAKKELISYSELLHIFTNETESNLAKQEEYAELLGISVDELRNTVYKTNPENLEKFANELGYTVEELENMKNVLGGYTLSDLFALPTETIEKYQEMGEMLSTITTQGTMSANTLQTIIDKYPNLMQGADGSFSQKNIQDNILSLFGFNKDSSGKATVTEGIMAIYAKQFYEQLKNSTAVYDSFLTFAEQQGTISGDVLLKLQQFDTFSDEALRLIKDQGLETVYNAFMENVELEVDLAKDFKQMLASLQTQQWDREQQQLRDVLEGLQSINAQREKEIELIKAKRNLENAQKEKVLRYREGLGFVYEQDTNKVQEAKEEIEKLQQELEKSSLEYQIEQIEVQKQTLDALLNNETKSQDLLQKISEHTSVLSIIAASADANRSNAYNIQAQNGGDIIEEQLDTVISQAMQGLKMSNEALEELTKTLAGWEKVLSENMMFVGEVRIEGVSGTFNMLDATISGNVNGTLNSDGGKLTGPLTVGDSGATISTNPDDVNSYFELGADGTLKPAPGTTFILTSPSGEETEIASEDIVLQTSNDTKISGTVLAGTEEGAGKQTYLEGTITFDASKGGTLSLSNGSSVSYTGNVSFGTGSTFTTTKGSLSGTFVKDEEGEGLFLSGTLNTEKVNTSTGAGTFISGTLNAVSGTGVNLGNATLTLDQNKNVNIYFKINGQDETDGAYELGDKKVNIGILYTINGKDATKDADWTVSEKLNLKYSIGAIETSDDGEQVFTPFEGFELEGVESAVFDLGSVSLIYDSSTKLDVWDLLQTTGSGQNTVLANRLGIDNLVNIAQKLGMSDLVDIVTKLGKDDFVYIASKLGRSDFIGTISKLGRDDFVYIASKLGRSDFVGAISKLGRDDFVYIAQKLGREDFVEIATKLGMDDFVSLTTKLGTANFVEITQKLGMDDFVYIAQKLGVDAFVLIAQKLGIDDFVLIVSKLSENDLVDIKEKFDENDLVAIGDKLGLNDFVDMDNKLVVGDLIDGTINPNNLIDSAATKVTISEASLDQLLFPQLTNTIFDLTGTHQAILEIAKLDIEGTSTTSDLNATRQGILKAAGILYSMNESGVVYTKDEKKEGSWYADFYNRVDSASLNGELVVSDYASEDSKYVISNNKVKTIELNGITYGYIEDEKTGYGQFVMLNEQGNIVQDAEGKTSALLTKNGERVTTSATGDSWGYIDEQGKFNAMSTEEMSQATNGATVGSKVWIQANGKYGSFLKTFQDVIDFSQTWESELRALDQFHDLSVYSAYGLDQKVINPNTATIADIFKDPAARDMLAEYGYNWITYTEGENTWTLPEYLHAQGYITNRTAKTNLSQDTLNELEQLFTKSTYDEIFELDEEQNLMVFKEEVAAAIEDIFLKEGIQYKDLEATMGSFRGMTEYLMSTTTSESVNADQIKNWYNGETMALGMIPDEYYLPRLTDAEGNKLNIKAWDYKQEDVEDGLLQLQYDNQVKFKEVLNKMDTTYHGFEIGGKNSNPEPIFKDYQLPDVVDNAAGGVYTKPTLVRVGEYSDSATDPEVIAPQSVIADTMSSVMKDSGVGNNLNTQSPIVSSAGLMVGKGRQQQSDDLSKSVNKLTATGENIITSGGNIVQATDSAITTVDNLSSVIDGVNTVLSNVIEEDGTINSNFVASIVSAAVDGMVSSATGAIWNGVKTVGNTIGEGLSTAWEGVKSGFKTVGGWLGIVDNASGGVYDDETIVRVAEYADSATNPEVIAPQNIIRESLESALEMHEEEEMQQVYEFISTIMSSMVEGAILVHPDEAFQNLTGDLSDSFGNIGQIIGLIVGTFAGNPTLGSAIGSAVGKGVGFVDNLIDKFSGKPLGRTLSNLFKFADGGITSRDSEALVNELGTEAIVTPQGTITALPSHSGVVPADLTRNLYQLGEIAPNLIKDTYYSSQQSLMQAIQNSKAVEDNSVNIQKLDAVFQVNETFDFDKFLTEVRGVVSTTKNNR